MVHNRTFPKARARKSKGRRPRLCARWMALRRTRLCSFQSLQLAFVMHWRMPCVSWPIIRGCGVEGWGETCVVVRRCAKHDRLASLRSWRWCGNLLCTQPTEIWWLRMDFPHREFGVWNGFSICRICFFICQHFSPANCFQHDFVSPKRSRSIHHSITASLQARMARNKLWSKASWLAYSTPTKCPRIGTGARARSDLWLWQPTTARSNVKLEI